MGIFLKGIRRPNEETVEVEYDSESQSGGSMPIVQVATVTLTDDQIKALPNFAGAVELVPAPGSGKAIYHVWSVWRLDTRVAAYSNFGVGAGINLFVNSWIYANYYESLEFAFTGNEGEEPLIFAYNDQNIAAGAGNYFKADMLGVVSAVEDRPLQIQAYNPDGPFTGGDASQSLKVTVYYVVLDL